MTHRAIIHALCACLSMAVGCATFLNSSSQAADPPPATIPATIPTTHTKLILDAQTTLITEPLNPDGTPNYLAALDAELAKGVTAENNAAIPLLRAMGPILITEEKFRPLVLQKLQLDLPVNGAYFVDLWAFARVQHKAGADSAKPFDDAALAKAEEATEKKPWKKEQFPLIAAWIESNQQPLDQITAASRLPRIYYPLVSMKSPPSLSDGLLAMGLARMRSVVNALSTRSMLRLAGGDSDGAQADIQTIHRLARLEAQQPFLLSLLVAIAVDTLGFQDGQVLLRSTKLTPAEARTLLSDLRGLREIPSSSETIDKSERYFDLDSFMPAVRGRYDETLQAYMWLAGPNLLAPPPPPSHTLDQADWNIVLRAVNRRYDQVSEATSKPLAAARHDALQPLIREQEAAGVPGPPFDLFEVATTHESDETPEEKSKRYTAQLRQFLSRRSDETQAAYSERLALFFTRVETTTERIPILVDRTTAAQRLTLVAAALAVYHADHDKYPETLDSLQSPSYLPQIPLDPFTAKPLIYRLTPEGYVLYSVGDNGQDDGGKDRTAGGDDIVMRMP